MRRNATAIFLVCCAWLTACSNPPASPNADQPSEPEKKASQVPSFTQILDLHQVAGKSQDDVSSILGKPISCEPSKYGSKCQFEQGDTEIVFINGKADWITINAMDNAPFSPDALPFLGLETRAPSFEGDDILRWQSIDGFLELNLFKGEKGIWYAYMKVATP